MLFCEKTDSAVASTADVAQIKLGGSFRLPVTKDTADKVKLGGSFRLPSAPSDSGKIKLGGSFRLPIAKG